MYFAQIGRPSENTCAAEVQQGKRNCNLESGACFYLSQGDVAAVFVSARISSTKFDVLVGKWSGKTKRPLLGPGEPLDLIQTEEARHKLALYSGRRAGVR